MRVFKNIDEIELGEKTAVALGNFDGVHLGHAELIKRTVAFAKERGLASAVFTFSNHPQNYILGKTIVPSITNSSDKEALIAAYDVDYLFSLTFDKSFQTMSPDSFIEDLVLKSFDAAAVFCGFNFNFGKAASGNTELLKSASMSDSFELEILPAFMINDNIVSSTLIRDIVSSGNVDRCPVYLGRRFSLSGEVVRDRGNGRKIGFPTANILLESDMLAPSSGVYATITVIDGQSHNSVTNVGTRPTIGDGKMLAESHLFDFSEEIYGEEIKIEFVKKIRNEIKFSGLEELGAQIAKDKMEASKILAF